VPSCVKWHASTPAAPRSRCVKLVHIVLAVIRGWHDRHNVSLSARSSSRWEWVRAFSIRSPSLRRRAALGTAEMQEAEAQPTAEPEPGVAAGAQSMSMRAAGRPERPVPAPGAAARLTGRARAEAQACSALAGAPGLADRAVPAAEPEEAPESEEARGSAAAARAAQAAAAARRTLVTRRATVVTTPATRAGVESKSASQRRGKSLRER
jgi:hypothetical protein